MDAEEVDAQLSWGDIKCEGCELLLDFTATELKDKTLQALITTYVTASCNLVPPGVAQGCQVICAKYLPQVFDELSRMINAEVLCKKIKMCPAQSRKESFLKLLKDPQAKLLPKNILCTPCKWAVNKFLPLAEKYLPQLISELVNVCKVLPVDVQSSCTSTITEFGDRIGKNVLSQLTSSAVCQRFGACQKANEDANSNRVVSFSSYPQTAEDFERRFGSEYVCDACKKFFGFLEKRVTDPKFVQAITDTFHKTCNSLGSIAEQCNKLVDQYLPQALKQLADDVNPDTTCPQLHLCPSS